MYIEATQELNSQRRMLRKPRTRLKAVAFLAKQCSGGIFGVVVDVSAGSAVALANSGSGKVG